MANDIFIQQDQDPNIPMDWVYDESGDLLADETKLSLVLNAIFTDRRALPEQVAESSLRRGSIVEDEGLPVVIGSLLWTLIEQSPLTKVTIQTIKREVERALVEQVEGIFSVIVIKSRVKHGLFISISENGKVLLNIEA